MADFERNLTELEKVVERLEQGDLSLEESVKLFEEGVKLSASCKKELEAAEGKVQVLMEQGGKLKPRDLQEETTAEEAED
ncbi:exodeoxyribonuclease VII small subunit [Edaphobacter albus]|uniref:exodeoxyribonuclease VII small subunit n=1 Tax=Edaphobacter sp. 4G125 TaxID=2763071 RepID=UPI001646ABC9|nr:exodeoxyribonuclease VII small subunit [Edaphobacter sp. 4G125]QNI36076.1 exodeoxyribonuclease VII small subunit [Edaphobacter sp. 4G125]